MLLTFLILIGISSLNATKEKIRIVNPTNRIRITKYMCYISSLVAYFIQSSKRRFHWNPKMTISIERLLRLFACVYVAVRVRVPVHETKRYR